MYIPGWHSRIICVPWFENHPLNTIFVSIQNRPINRDLTGFIAKITPLGIFLGLLPKYPQ